MKPKILFHATSARFSQFKDKPAWFSLNATDAAGWHRSSNAAHTYICTYTGGNIASIEQTVALAEQVFPNSKFHYAMLDKNLADFPAAKINQLINLIKSKGFDAALIKDLNTTDFSSIDSVSLCVLNPSLNISIHREYHEKHN